MTLLQTARPSRPTRATAAASLAEQAYAFVKREIITMRLRPSEVLNEAELMALTGIGRTPVHQALHRLVHEGMLTIMPRKGIMVRPVSLDDVLAITEAAGVPVLSSHEGPDWKSPRTLDDERARRIAAGGGVIGVGIYRHDTLMSAPRDERWPGFVAKSCDDNLAIWSHYANAVGAANVVLGSDLNSVISRPRAGGQCPNGLRNAGDLPDYLGVLTKRGIPLTALDHSADRVLRLLGAVEAKADPSVQQHARHLLRAAASAFTSPL